LIKVIISWFRISPKGTLGRIYRFIVEITEPFIAVFRKVIPMSKVGRSYIDFSPIIAILTIQFILFVLRFLLYKFL
jgi:uncharacterized protein YggT (Ycf19 family)